MGRKDDPSVWDDCCATERGTPLAPCAGPDVYVSVVGSKSPIFEEVNGAKTTRPSGATVAPMNAPPPSPCTGPEMYAVGVGMLNAPVSFWCDVPLTSVIGPPISSDSSGIGI